MSPISNITSLVINGACLESFPAQHECTVTFSDGSSKTSTFRHADIYVLTQSIEKNRIVFNSTWTISHFSPHEKELPLPSLENIMSSLQRIQPQFQPQTQSTSAHKCHQVVKKIFSRFCQFWKGIFINAQAKLRKWVHLSNKSSTN